MHCSGLHQALSTFDEAHQMAKGKSGRDLPIASSTYNGKGQLLYERDDLKVVVEHLETAVNLDEQWGNVEALISSCAFLGKAYLAQDNFDSALAKLQQASQLDIRPVHGLHSTMRIAVAL